MPFSLEHQKIFLHFFLGIEKEEILRIENFAP